MLIDYFLLAVNHANSKFGGPWWFRPTDKELWAPQFTINLKVQIAVTERVCHLFKSAMFLGSQRNSMRKMGELNSRSTGNLFSRSNLTCPTGGIFHKEIKFSKFISRFNYCRRWICKFIVTYISLFVNRFLKTFWKSFFYLSVVKIFLRKSQLRYSRDRPLRGDSSGAPGGFRDPDLILTKDAFFRWTTGANLHTVKNPI